MSNIISGKDLANAIKKQLKQEIEEQQLHSMLAVVLVGENPASKTYVKNKHKACVEVGITPLQINLPEATSEEELLKEISFLNENPLVNGILVQFPLPSHINTKRIMAAIAPNKDVDGFTVGSSFVPCTPKGVIRLLDSIPNYDLSGKVALVIGRSDIVGKPVAKLLMDRNCTVIQAHSKTRYSDLLHFFTIADIVVSAVGKQCVIGEFDAMTASRYKYNLVDFERKTKDRVIIDVGINRNAQGNLCGDFDEMFKATYSNYYTSVPGGVGPMTIAMLLENTILATKNSKN